MTYSKKPNFMVSSKVLLTLAIFRTALFGNFYVQNIRKQLLVDILFFDLITWISQQDANKNKKNKKSIRFF